MARCHFAYCTRIQNDEKVSGLLLGQVLAVIIIAILTTRRPCNFTAAIVESKSLSANRENGFPPPHCSFNLSVYFSGSNKVEAVACIPVLSFQPFYGPNWLV